MLQVWTLCAAGYAKDAIVGAYHRTSHRQEHNIIWRAGLERDTIFQASSAGVSVNSVNCAAPMFADDLALVAASGERLQTLLDICSSYASKWRYQFNSSKSGVMVFGESSRSRPALRNSRSWILGSSSISEVDNYHHLGILRSLSNSSRPKIAERCSAGRSAFFSLNSLGSRFGCLHPITSSDSILLSLYLF